MGYGERVPRHEQPAWVLRMRQAAEHCVELLGTELLRREAEHELLARLQESETERAEYFGQLRLRVLQLVAWVIGERRGAVPSGSRAGASTYRERYSVRKIREAASTAHDGDVPDPWQRVERVLSGLWASDSSIGVTSWGSELFDPRRTPWLRDLHLGSEPTVALITRIERDLVEPALQHTGADLRLLGQIHEWLLERTLLVSATSRRVKLDAGKVHERRTTGSYFTPDSLVQHLLDTCLESVLDARIDPTDFESSVERLLRLRIVDPACGTGVFLIAAARRIASRIEGFRAKSGAVRVPVNPLREVICRCLYGVDIGATAVALCRLCLWFECGSPFEPIALLDQHIRRGNSMFGAWPGFESGGLLDAAFSPSPGDEVAHARALKRRNRLERRDATRASDVHAEERCRELWMQRERVLADLWCASFVWPKRTGIDVPTQTDFDWASKAPGAALCRWREPLGALAERHAFFHWHLEFPEVFAPAARKQPEGETAGFDLVIGNPPWVAHAGRATQPLDPGVKRFLCANYASFAGFPTTHGAFIELATRLLAARGRVGLIVPASVADLAGYAPTRRAHDRRCALLGPLPDFGEGRFAGVTQPCIALVSERTASGCDAAQAGSDGSWAIERSDLDNEGLELLERLAKQARFPESLFGERGFQSTPASRQYIRRQAAPEGNYRVPLREGTDVREYQLGSVSHHADVCLIGRGIRPLEEFARVDLVVRQTARYPIAAKSDGLAFRNSLLAVVRHPDWPWPLLLCILNSSLIRWLHYCRFRDGRQPILPQLKVGHLRSLPSPVQRGSHEFACLNEMGAELAARNRGVLDSERAQIDGWVSALYGLSHAEHRRVAEWHRNRPR